MCFFLALGILAECSLPKVSSNIADSTLHSILSIESLIQGILKGISLYHWPPIWLVWNQLWQLKFFLQNRLLQTSQTGGQWYSDTSLFSIPCLIQSWTADRMKPGPSFQLYKMACTLHSVPTNQYPLTLYWKLGSNNFYALSCKTLCSRTNPIQQMYFMPNWLCQIWHYWYKYWYKLLQFNGEVMHHGSMEQHASKNCNQLLEIPKCTFTKWNLVIDIIIYILILFIFSTPVFLDICGSLRQLFSYIGV